MGRRGRGGTWPREDGGRRKRSRWAASSSSKSATPNVTGLVSVEPSRYAIEYHQRTTVDAPNEVWTKDKIPAPETPLSTEEASMMEILGFHGFGSTKGKAVVTNQFGPAKGAARIEAKSKRQYRQYKNRKGGAQLLSSEASITSKIQH